MKTNRLSCLGIVAFACFGAFDSVHAQNTVGATLPFTEYEAEAGTLGGGATVVAQVGPPTDQYSTPTLEASGRAYVALTATGQSVTWTNNTSSSFTAVNLRASIPNAPTGGGITATLDLYVNGTFRQAVTLSSKQGYLYAGAGIANDHNPADGKPTHVFDEVHFFLTGAAIAPGSTIMLKQDSTNTASFYYIDCIDLEVPPAALSQPANSLSIVTYGAVANNPSIDSTQAIQNCIADAQTQGKIVWIPQGTFYEGLGWAATASGITIQGAGVWYSVIYRDPPIPPNEFLNNTLTLTSVTLKNVMLDSNSTSGSSNDGGVGAIGIDGTNWLIDNVWIQHSGAAIWAGGTNGTIQNSRVTGDWSDGINLNNFSNSSTVGTNLTVQNCFLRSTGDDSIALNGTDSTGHTPLNGVQVLNNTIASTFGHGIALFGARNVVISNNFIHDTVENNGIGVGYFQQTASLIGVQVQGNTLLRCGGNAYNDMISAIEVGTDNTTYGSGTPYQDSNLVVSSNTIIDPLFGGMLIKFCNNLVCQGNSISHPSTYGITVESTALGNGVFNNNLLGTPSSGYQAFFDDAPNYKATTSSEPVIPPVAAGSYNTLSGALHLETCAEGGQDLGTISNGNYTVYNNVNLNGVNSFVARVASANSGGNIVVHLDSATGTIVGTCAVSGTGGAQKWTTKTCNITGATGFHNVYLVYTGGAGSLFNLEWFAFQGNSNEIEASSYNTISGSLGLEACSEGGQDLDNIFNGNYAVYNNIDLNGVVGFQARVASANSGGNIVLHLDSPTGTVIGTCPVAGTGGWQTYVTQTVSVSANASGYHNVYLVFTGGSGALFNVEWFAFQGGLGATEAASYNSVSAGALYLETCSEGGQDLCNIFNGTYAVYNNVNLNNVTSFQARVASANSGGNIVAHLDSATGTVIGTCAVSGTGGWQTWTTKTINVSGATGYHNVYLVFTGGSSALFNVEWFAFQGILNGTVAASYNTVSGVTTQTCSEGGLNLTSIVNGSSAVYNNIDLNGMTSFSARVASSTSGGNIVIHLDSATGTVIGTCAVPGTGGTQSWITSSCALNSSATGYHNVYLVFTGGTGSLFNLEWFALQGGLSPIAASSYSSLSPGSSMYLETCVEGGQDLASINNGNYAVYNNVNINGTTTFLARVASANAGGNIVIHLDSPTGTVIGTCSAPGTGGWQTWTTQSCSLSGASGTHNIYLVFATGGFNLEWFKFQ